MWIGANGCGDLLLHAPDARVRNTALQSIFKEFDGDLYQHLLREEGRLALWMGLNDGVDCSVKLIALRSTRLVVGPQSGQDGLSDSFDHRGLKVRSFARARIGPETHKRFERVNQPCPRGTYAGAVGSLLRSKSEQAKGMKDCTSPCRLHSPCVGSGEKVNRAQLPQR